MELLHECHQINFKLHFELYTQSFDNHNASYWDCCASILAFQIFVYFRNLLRLTQAGCGNPPSE